MQKCELINQLSSLKRSSIESVDNALVKDSADEYLHVVRPIEDEMRNILRQINANGHKCLVLLCGSAGDGKSHLLSYLKHSDQKNENLLENYYLYNDATESRAPSLTSIETLSEELIEFDDNHLEDDNGFKMVLAINLGTLNNFIESDRSENYSQLKKFVEGQGIIAEYLQSESEYIEGSPFQYISFSDYHMFELTEEGATFEYLDAVIEKIVTKNEKNKYYNAYEKCEDCPNHISCPIKHNYEFLMDDDVQDAIECFLLSVEFEDKIIVSTRDVFDFLYSVIVPPDYDAVINNISSVSDIEFITSYIHSTLPMLLFQSQDTSTILTSINAFDPLKERSKHTDTEAVKIHSLDDVKGVVKNSVDNTPYSNLYYAAVYSNESQINPEVKQATFNFLMRLKSLKENHIRKEGKKDLKRFLKFLYYQNSDNERKLSPLYSDAIKAIMRWNGVFDEGYACLDNEGNDYWIIERLKIEPSIGRKQGTGHLESLVRYSPTLSIWLKKEDGDDSQAKCLSIDFSLFELITKMRNGYLPTAHDKNLHTDFDSYVSQINLLGEHAKRVVIQSKETNEKNVFEENNFGDYVFKVKN